MSMIASMNAYAARRKSLLARVHILRKEINLAEDEYRMLLLSITGKQSAADLDARELDVWVTHLERLRKRYKKPKQQYQLTPVERKIWSLWQKLVDNGRVKNRKMDGLIGYVRTHIARVDHISWLNDAQQSALIDQLKEWLARA